MTQFSHSYSSLKMYENCPYRYYRQKVVTDVQDVQGEAAAYGEAIHKALELRLRDKTPLPDHLAKFESVCHMIEQKPGVLELEREMTLTESLTPTTWFAKDAWLRSKLDVLVVDGDKATILDWKTGKRRPDPEQLDIFAVQVFQHFPEVTVANTALVWLKDMAVDKFSRRREDAPEIWERVLSKVARIKASDETGKWVVRPSGLCPWCPLHGKCPATK